MRCVDGAQSPLADAAVLIFAVFLAIALAALGGYFFGLQRRTPLPPSPSPASAPVGVALADADPTPEPASGTASAHVDSEKTRLIRSLAAETFALRGKLDVEATAAGDLAKARVALIELDAAIAAVREETARFRQLVVDIENNAPPPILLGSNEPDDLKLIVGIGPVLERMLHNLGIGSFRQIARWTERDIAEFDAKLPEFPGRIVRDQWVTQARALHESKYGESPLNR